MARRCWRSGSLEAGARQVSSLDHDASVVDTGTQADETSLIAEVVIESVRSRGLGVRSKPCPTIYGVPASISGVSRFVGVLPVLPAFSVAVGREARPQGWQKLRIYRSRFLCSRLGKQKEAGTRRL